MECEQILVFCASSRRCDPEYHAAAGVLGRALARAGIRIVYGGGRVGSMGALADAALAEGGEVVGVIPRFMAELEWGHAGISELHFVDDMRERKRRMLEGAGAVVALPGGSGTLEELFEVITLKRLGIYLGPIVLVNTRGFFDALLALLERSIDDRFMDERHADMWQVVDHPDRVLPAIASAPAWTQAARDFAAI